MYSMGQAVHGTRPLPPLAAPSGLVPKDPGTPLLI